MNTIVLVVVYMTTCIGMIIFNIGYIIHVQQNKKRSIISAERYEGQLRRALGSKEEKRVRDMQQKWMKQLERAESLMSFEKGLANLWDAQPRIHGQLLELIRPVFLHLAEHYPDMDNISGAYFAHVIARFELCKDMEIDFICPALFRLLRRPSMYCRQNAMEVFSSSKSARRMTEAVTILSEENLFFHEKSLTDSLLEFKGSHKLLAAQLLDSFSLFSSPIQKVVIDYLRIEGLDYRQQLYPVLVSEAQDKEVRIAAIRYFGKYVYEPAREVLIGFLQQSDEKNWEYAAVAAFAILSYAGKDTENALIKALYSHNWYIRKNAAKSLIDRNVPYKNIASIIDGNDRYAREVLIYYWNRRQTSVSI